MTFTRFFYRSFSVLLAASFASPMGMPAYAMSQTLTNHAPHLEFLFTQSALANEAVPYIESTAQAKVSVDRDLTPAAQDKTIRQRLLEIAQDISSNQRLGAASQRIVLEFSETVRAGRQLSIGQIRYAKLLIADYDSQESPTFDLDRNKAIVERLAAQSTDDLQWLSTWERTVCESFLVAANGPDAKLLTRRQLDFAEGLMTAARERRLFHQFMDSLFDAPYESQIDRVPELIVVLDALLRFRWARNWERARFFGFLRSFTDATPSSFDDEFLSYIQDQSPMRKTMLYESPGIERYLVAQLLRATERTPEAITTLENALLHRGGLRLVSRTSVIAVLRFLAHRHRKTQLDPKILTALQDSRAMKQKYDWWSFKRFKGMIKELLTPERADLPASLRKIHRRDIPEARKQILTVIQEAWNANMIPTVEWAEQNAPDILTLALDPRVFGSWKLALELAGIPIRIPASIKITQTTYSRELVIELAKKNPSIVRNILYMVNNVPNWIKAAIAHFGSVNTALEAAELSVINFSDFPLPPLMEDLSGPVDVLLEWVSIQRKVIKAERDIPKALPPYYDVIGFALSLRHVFRQFVKDSEPLIAPTKILRVGKRIESIYLDVLQRLALFGIPRLEGWRDIVSGYNIAHSDDKTLLIDVFAKVSAALDAGKGIVITPDVSKTIESNFQKNVYDQLPWPEKTISRNNVQWLQKRAGVPGVEMVVECSADGSWTVQMQNGWLWRPPDNSRRLRSNPLSLAWDNALKKFSLHYYSDFPRGSRRFDLSEFRLPQEPLIYFKFLTPDVEIKIRSKELEIEVDRGERIRGMMGFSDSTQFNWEIEFVDRALNEFSSVPAGFLSPAALMNRLFSAVVFDNLRVRTQLYYPTSNPHNIHLPQILLMFRQDGFSWVRIQATLNSWLSKDYGIVLSLKEVPGKGRTISFKPVDGNTEAFRERLLHLPFDLTAPQSTTKAVRAAS